MTTAIQSYIQTDTRQLCQFLKEKPPEETVRNVEWSDQRNAGNFPSPVSFEWDEQKNLLNRTKHTIDFEDATEIFYGPIFLRRSDRNNEERWIAVGSLESRLIAVVFTRRADVIRIISARRAWKNEERE